jgi:DNA repair exonuclease SbcCD ATPase subunit
MVKQNNLVSFDLISITLCNIVGYKGKHIFTFSPGLTGVIGVNGAGKSTILNFIPFLLWGVTSEKVSSFLNSEVFPDPTGKEECYASLDFFCGCYYRICRSVDQSGKGMSHRLDISLDGEKWEMYSKSEKVINKYIIDLLKITYDMAVCSIFSTQGKTDYFFTLSNSDQKEMIDSFLHAQYEVRKDRLKSRAAFFDKLLSNVDRYALSIKNKLRDLQTTRVAAELQIKSLNDVICNLGGVAIEEELSELRLKKSELEYTVSSAENLFKSLATAQQQVEILEEKIHSLESSVANLMNRRDQTQASLKAAEDALNLSMEKAKSITKFKEPSQIEIDSTKEQLKYYMNLCNDYTTKVTSSQNVINLLEEELESLKEKGKKVRYSVESGVCYVCNRPGANLEHLQSELKELRQTYAEKIKEHQIRVDSLQEDLKELQKFKLLKEEWDSKLSLIESAIDKSIVSAKSRAFAAIDLRKKYRNVQAEKKKYAEITSQYEKESSALPDLVNPLRSRVDEILVEISDLKNKIQDIDGTKAKIRDITNRITELESANETIIASKAQIQILNDQIQELKKSEDSIAFRLQRAERVHEKLLLRSEEYKFMKKVFDLGYERYFTHALEMISKQTNDILNEINSPLSIEISCLSKSKGSTISSLVKKGGKPISYTLASGGQRVVLGICFRLALWRFINTSVRSPLSFFILDEVFGQLDQENSAYVFNQILKLKQYFKYIIITSHTDHVWNTDNKITVS